MRIVSHIAGVGITLACLILSPLASLQSTTEIVYVAEVNGNRDIYKMSADGVTLERLTDDPAEEGSPVWSPDRRQIAFVSNRTGDFEVFVMDANGHNQTNVTNNGHYNNAPAWSPDGRYIVFITAGTRSNDIYMMESNGSNPVAITADGYEDLKAIFAPDGRSIYFISIQDSQAPALYRTDLNGQNVMPVLSGEEEYDAPVISPDGQRLAYVMTRFDNQGNVSEIYTANLDGQNAAPVTEVENAFVTSLSWSPSGDELVYTFSDKPNKRTQIYAVNINNGGSRMVSEQSTIAYDASWSTYEGIVSDNSPLVGGSKTTTDSGDSENCTPATLFAVGMTSVVDLRSTSGASTRISAWTAPTGGEHNSDAEPGMSLFIVGGPRCEYSDVHEQYVRYWQVEFVNRRGRKITGDAWVAESLWQDGNLNYLICPLSNPDC